MIAAYAEALANGDGRIIVDGGVVDTPVVLRAERLLAWADAIQAADHRVSRTSAVDHQSVGH